MQSFIYVPFSPNNLSQTRPIGWSPSMMQTARPPLDPSMLKQTPPVKSYLDTYLAHNTPEMQKDPTALGSFSNFPLSMLTSALIYCFIAKNTHDNGKGRESSSKFIYLESD